MSGSGGPSELASFGSTVLFFSSDNSAITMWESDGTKIGTREVMQLDGYSSARIIERFDDALFFVTGFATHYNSGGGESYLTLWITDGTKEGTIELDTGSAPYYSSNVPQGIRQPDPGSCSFYVVGDNGLYFFVKSQTSLDGEYPKAEIYSYRTNADSPKLVHEARGTNHIPLLAVDAGKLYFSIKNEIWTSDGEAATKLLVYNPQSSYLFGARELQTDDKYFYARNDSAHGTELWLRRNDSDFMLKDINPGINSSDPSCFAHYKNLLFFSASTLENGRELWISDGTEEGTKMLLDIRAGDEDSSPDHFTPTDKGLVFVTRHNHLWKTDGTSEGTVMISPSLSQSIEYRNTPPQLNGAYVYSANLKGTKYGYELYRSDRNGVTLIKDINAGSAGSDPYSFIELRNRVFFSADDGIHGRELWITDGTESGTRLVKDLSPGSAGVEIGEAAVFDNRLCFVTVGGDREPELYLSNGSEAGTLPIAQYPPGSAALALTPAERNLFYLVTTYEQTEHQSETRVTVEQFSRTELWKTDGTSSGTMRLMAWQKTDFDSYELRDPFELDDRYHQIP